MDVDHAQTELGSLMDMDDITRVFIVEDEVIIAFDMSDMLESLGFEVVGPAVNLEAAKVLAAEEEIDAAFLDVNLGANKTSQPVADILRERKIPFIFVTAYDANQIEFRTTDDRVLRKPVTGKEMLSTLRQVLPDREKTGE